MGEFKVFEIGGLAININAISYIAQNGRDTIVHFIGGETVTMHTDVSSFIKAARTAK